MKRIISMVLVFFIIGGNLAMNINAALVDERGGVIFKAPDATDSQNHKPLIGNPEVYGTEQCLNWSDIESKEGVFDWSKIDKLADEYSAVNKKVSLTVFTASFAINDSPSWLFNDYEVRRIAKGYWMNFENGTKDYIVSAEIVDGANSISGTKSLAVSGLGLSTDPKLMPLKFDKGYAVQLDYSAITDGTIVMKATKNGAQYAVAEHSVKAGAKGLKNFEFVPDDAVSDYVVSFEFRGGKAIFDNINIMEMREGFHRGNLTFPNYFDPVFREKWDNFVKAFGEKYDNDPRIDLIYTGGYGRWEELTLNDDTDLGSFEDQWVTFGYDDQRFINQVMWGVDTYIKHFPNKYKENKIMISGAGFAGTDTFKDTQLTNWIVPTLTLGKNVINKYNGWQYMCTEWNDETSAYLTPLYRNKYSKTTKNIFEQGGQINNTMSEYMGNPISMYNKAITYGVSYYWVYSNDLIDRYITRYQHYANESVGGQNSTKAFIYMNQNSYFSKGAKQRYIHNNIENDIYQVLDKAGTRAELIEIDGVYAAQTNPQNNTLAFSIDDRLKSPRMYGSTLTIEYLDRGTDNFAVYVNTDKGQEKLGEIKKSDSGKWAKISFYNTDYTSTSKGGATNLLREIEIDDRDDGVEAVRSLEIDYVGGAEYEEEVAGALEPKDGSRVSLDTPVELSFNNESSMLSAIALPVSCIDDEYIYTNIRAQVYGVINGEEQLLTTKDYFMPAKNDWFRIPVAHLPIAKSYRVVVSTTEGRAFIRTDGNNIGYRLLTYAFTQQDAKSAEKYFLANKEFIAVKVSQKLGKDAKAYKLMPDGREMEIAITNIDGNTVYLEPQTSARYRIEGANGDCQILVPIWRGTQTLPTREIFGEKAAVLSGKTSFVASELGFVDAGSANGVFTAQINKRNASLFSEKDFEFIGNDTHSLRVVLKNQSGAQLSKVYWAVDGAYSESNSAVFPIVPNDNNYREYSFDIGYEKRFQEENITGIRIIPALNTDSGIISIATAELREGREYKYTNREALDITALDSSISVSGLISNGNGNGLILAIIATLVGVVGIVFVAVFMRKRKKNAKNLN